MFTHVENILRSFEARGVPAYDMLIYHKGKEVYRRTYGFSDYAKQKPLCGNERYNIYSASKLITCTAAMQLSERGLLSLDDDLGKYLPEFYDVKVKDGDSLRPPKSPIQIKHLFTMTAGFSYDMGTKNCKRAFIETDGRCPTREFMKYLARDPLLFDSGEHYNYSLCHDVLAAVVEQIAGKRFNDYVKENIFRPCDMEHSTFAPAEEDLSTIAAQYQYDEASGRYDEVGKRILWFRAGSEYDSGGAGCIATTEDYVRFLEGLRTGLLLKPQTLLQMTTNRLPDAILKREFELSSRGYGYGLGMRVPLTDASVSDFGWGGAAASFCACSIEKAYSFFYAQHVLRSPNQGDRILLPHALEADLGYVPYTTAESDENRWF